jgi:hypothetical protein
MSDALSRLQASASAADIVPQATVETCLAQGLVKRVQELAEEKAALALEAFRTEPDDADSDKPVRKMGQGGDPRIGEIDSELESLQDVMREHTGHVTVAKVISNGDWRRWADANPAREDGRDKRGRPIISAFDIGTTGGFCDGSALLARLGDFVTEWNGEPLSEGQWEWLSEKMPMGDQKVAAQLVVSFYEVEGAKAAPKSRSDSSTTPTKSPASDSPEPSGSPTSDSSAGSRASDTSTSTPKGS